jgi:pimeloyl-ACP methyl ester carboxylesterase
MRRNGTRIAGKTATLIVAACVAVMIAGCEEGEDPPKPTPTARPIPSPIAFASEPAAAYTLGDPAFAALPAATAYFGRLGGANYQIEIPDDWNGRLVLYLHGFHNFAPTLWVSAPGIRGYLIRNGFAWAASSYSSNAQITGLAADETAALWDHFTQRFGRPDWTYVTGHSMGGGAASISAERYAARYDGALALCGTAGSSPQIAYLGDLFVAGAFAAGVTQSELETRNPSEIVDTRILPKLNDPETNRRFEEIAIDLSGGPRPFAREGLQLAKEGDGWFAWSRLVLAVPGVFNNADTVYRLGPGSDVSSDEFNAAAVRFGANLLPAFAAEGDNFGGRLAIPLLTLHATGDLVTPISEQQIVRRRAEDAGTGDLLVQRTVRAPGSCAFSDAEWEASLEALIGWVEQGERPDGEDLLSEDLRDIGRKFTLAPRSGSRVAGEAPPGAGDRVIVRGKVTFDGRPLGGGYVWVVVRKNGLMRYCSLAPFTTLPDGGYEVPVAAEAETHGCGEPGAELYVDVYASSLGRSYWSAELARWPAGSDLTFDAAIEEPGSYLPNTMFRGSVIDTSGQRLPPGTVIEAYIGDTLCGATALPPTAMALGDPSTYYLPVVGPQSISGCDQGGAISFRVNGEVVGQTGINDFDGRFQGQHLLDLSLP